jgi:hypothetical protein
MKPFKSIFGEASELGIKVDGLVVVCPATRTVTYDTTLSSGDLKRQLRLYVHICFGPSSSSSVLFEILQIEMIPAILLILLVLFCLKTGGFAVPETECALSNIGKCGRFVVPFTLNRL